MSHIDRTSLAHHVPEVLSKLAKSSPDWPVYHALKKALDADDDEKLFEAFKLLRRALRELKRQVEACPMLISSRSIHLENIGTWEELLSAKCFHTPLNQQKTKPLDQQRLNNLISLDDTLRLWYPQGRLKHSAEVLLKRQLDRLLEEVEISDLPPEIKAFIITQLSTLAWALSNFQFFGAEGVYDIVTSVAARSRATTSEQRDSPPARKYHRLVGRFWRLLDNTVQLNRGRAALGELWETLISGGGPPALPPGL